MRLGLSLVCVLAVIAASAAADEPTGTFTIPMGGGSVPPAPGRLLVPTPTILGWVWCSQPGDTVCTSAKVATDSSGALTGTGFVGLQGNLSGQVELALVGRMTGTLAHPEATLHFTAAGSATDGMAAVEIRGSGRLKCGSDPLSGALGAFNCETKTRLCAFEGHHRTACFKLPPFGLGTELEPFSIQLDLETGANGAVTGIGSVEIAGVGTLGYTARGRYDSGADTTNLELTGTDPAEKTKLALRNVVLSAGSASAGTVVFKIAGQRGRVELPAP
jgi:hypothetical protein